MSAEPVARPRLVRRNYGAGHGYKLDGEQVVGVTTVINASTPKDWMKAWVANLTASHAIDHWDELAALGIAERYTTLSKAVYANTAAKRGTSIHDLLMQLARGEEPEVPDDLDGHVQSYLRFAEEWQVQDELVETAIVSERPYCTYAGTLDLVARLGDGNRWLLDFKTGNAIYPETALQLAAYRYATSYLGIDGDLHPMPEIDHVGVVWLRADGYDLHPYVADEQTFRTFQYAYQVASFVLAAKDDRDTIIGRALRPPPRAAA